MRILGRIAIGVGVVLTALVAAATVLTVSLVLDATRTERPVGFQMVTAPDPQGRPLQVAVWYPTSSRPGLHFVRSGPEIVAANGTVAGRGLPLIVISRGGGEPLSGRVDGAMALASAGFVAAVVIHADDQSIDRRYVAMPHWLAERPREIHLALQYLLNDWPAHAQLDARRVGIFGYSDGGLAALIALGGVPNAARLASDWPQPPGATRAIPASVWVHDPTIKAAVLAAPAADDLFMPDGLSRVTVPVQLWNGTIDRIEPYPKNAALLLTLLPKRPELHLIPGAGHFTFISPCPHVLRWLSFCAETGGFDRVAFHRDFNRSVIEFYQRNL
jgi:predicted dienelactone hydrolase